MFHTKASETSLRKRLEYCYDHGLLGEAIRIGNMLDSMQCFLLTKEQEKDESKKSTICFSLEPIRA